MKRSSEPTTVKYAGNVALARDLSSDTVDTYISTRRTRAHIENYEKCKIHRNQD